MSQARGIAITLHACKDVRIETYWQKTLNISAKIHHNLSIFDRISFYNNAQVMTDLKVKQY